MTTRPKDKEPFLSRLGNRRRRRQDLIDIAVLLKAAKTGRRSDIALAPGCLAHITDLHPFGSLHSASHKRRCHRKMSTKRSRTSPQIFVGSSTRSTTHAGSTR